MEKLISVGFWEWGCPKSGGCPYHCNSGFLKETYHFAPESLFLFTQICYMDLDIIFSCIEGLLLPVSCGKASLPVTLGDWGEGKKKPSSLSAYFFWCAKR